MSTSDAAINNKEVSSLTVVIDLSVPPQCVIGAHRNMKGISNAREL